MSPCEHPPADRGVGWELRKSVAASQGRAAVLHEVRAVAGDQRLPGAALRLSIIMTTRVAQIQGAAGCREYRTVRRQDISAAATPHSVLSRHAAPSVLKEVVIGRVSGDIPMPANRGWGCATTSEWFYGLDRVVEESGSRHVGMLILCAS